MLYKHELRNKVNRSRKNCRKLYYVAKVRSLKYNKPKDLVTKDLDYCNIFTTTENDSPIS